MGPLRLTHPNLVSRRDGRNAKAQRFEQTAQGHARAIRQLKALKPECVVMEATGVYYLDRGSGAGREAGVA
jgi:transposase